MSEVRTVTYSKELYEKFVGGDYRRKFVEEVKKAIQRDVPVEDRIRFAENICMAYINATGERPPAAGLNTLTAWILKDDLTNQERMKSRKSEYPILSKKQVKYRKDKEFPNKGTWLDVEHLQREIEREMKYIEQTKPSPVVTYNMYDLTEEELKEKGLWKYVKDKFEAEVIF